MSYIKIELSKVQRAVDRHTELENRLRFEVSQQLEKRLKETKQVGWFFKRTVNKVEHERKNNPFSYGPVIEEALNFDLRKETGLWFEHNFKAREYDALCKTIPPFDRLDSEFGWVYADEQLCNFIETMKNISCLDIEKKAFKLWGKDGKEAKV